MSRYKPGNGYYGSYFFNRVPFIPDYESVTDFMQRTMPLQRRKRREWTLDCHRTLNYSTVREDFLPHPIDHTFQPCVSYGYGDAEPLITWFRDGVVQMRVWGSFNDNRAAMKMLFGAGFIRDTQGIHMVSLPPGLVVDDQAGGIAYDKHTAFPVASRYGYKLSVQTSETLVFRWEGSKVRVLNPHALAGPTRRLISPQLRPAVEHVAKPFRAGRRFITLDTFPTQSAAALYRLVQGVLPVEPFGLTYYLNNTPFDDGFVKRPDVLVRNALIALGVSKPLARASVGYTDKAFEDAQTFASRCAHLTARPAIEEFNDADVAAVQTMLPEEHRGSLSEDVRNTMFFSSKAPSGNSTRLMQRFLRHSKAVLYLNAPKTPIEALYTGIDALGLRHWLLDKAPKTLHPTTMLVPHERVEQYRQQLLGARALGAHYA